MSQLTVLSDAELDAVSGGLLNGGTGGAGGNGGTAANGAVVDNSLVLLADLSTRNSTATSTGGNGGRGGDINLRLRF